MLSAAPGGCHGAIKIGASEVQKVGRQAGAAPDAAARAAGRVDRSFARGVRARHSHRAHRHPGARRIAGKLQSRRTRAALGFGHQGQRRASRRAHDIDDRRRQSRRRGAHAAAGDFPAAPSYRGSGGFADRARGNQGPHRRSDGRGRFAGAARRRCGAAAGGAGKSHRQCGEVHRARRRRRALAWRARGARRARRADRSGSSLPSPTAASGSRPPRSSGCSARSRKPTRTSRGAMAAPGSGSPSSKFWPS